MHVIHPFRLTSHLIFVSRIRVFICTPSLVSYLAAVTSYPLLVIPFSIPIVGCLRSLRFRTRLNVARSYDCTLYCVHCIALLKYITPEFNWPANRYLVPVLLRHTLSLPIPKNCPAFSESVGRYHRRRAPSSCNGKWENHAGDCASIAGHTVAQASAEGMSPADCCRLGGAKVETCPPR